MVAVAFADDFSAFYIHVSRLGKHTRNMEADPRVSLLITETDDGRADPQTLARLFLNGTADVLPRTDPSYEHVKSLYLARFPTAGQLFSLGDFNITCKVHMILITRNREKILRSNNKFVSMILSEKTV